MSNILTDYVNGTKSSIEKKTIITDLQVIQNELTSSIVPMYDTLYSLSLSRELSIKGDNVLRKKIKHYNKNTVVTIRSTLSTLVNNWLEVTEMIDSRLQTKVVYKDAIDFRLINILNYLEGLNFFTEYVVKYAIAVVFTNPTDPLSKRYIEEVTDSQRILQFANTMNLLNTPLDKFGKTIDKLKGLSYTGDDWNTLLGQSNKLNPYNAGLISVNRNPIYIIGIAINNWRINRHNLNKENLIKLQLKIMLIETELEASPERKESLTKQLDYHNNRANKLNMAIKQMEEV